MNLEVKDLRIGNYNLYLGRLDSINDGYDIDHVRNDKEGLHKPIPITDDWLLRFGFEKCKAMVQDGLVYYKNNSNFYINQNGEFGVFLDKELYSFYCLTTITNIHQLQNLFHALTGQELELKELSK